MITLIIYKAGQIYQTYFASGMSTIFKKHDENHILYDADEESAGKTLCYEPFRESKPTSSYLPLR